MRLAIFTVVLFIAVQAFGQAAPQDDKQQMTVEQLNIALVRARQAYNTCENDLATLWSIKNKKDEEIKDLKKMLQDKAISKEKEGTN